MHIGQRFWRRQGLGTKLSITNFVWVASILGLLVLGIAWDVSKSLQSRMNSDMQQGIRTLHNFIESTTRSCASAPSSWPTAWRTACRARSAWTPAAASRC